MNRDESIRVSTSRGVVCGQAEAGLKVFRGIPFARPPVRELRFRPPEPAEPWSAELDATAFAAASMQPPDAGPVPGMSRGRSSEDSLYLNVWAPRSDGPHPVFVWVHGGREFVGGTDDPIYDGSALAARGIVVVTVAYRLGLFGFLELGHLLGPEFACSGNNALLDLTAALGWVQDEIKAFGGDPGRVTVGGQSSGGLNVATLSAVDRARPLFHAMILESSFGGRPALPAAGAQAVTAALFEHLGIEAADSSKLLDLSADRLLEAQAAVFASNPFPFRPVLDAAVLERSGADAVGSGLVNRIPILVGSNLNEYDLFALRHPMRADPSVERMVNVDSTETARRLNSLYREGLPSLSDDQRRLRLMTAEEHWIPSVRLAESQVVAGGDAWMYRFDWHPTNGRFPGLRAAHTMELPFVFGTCDSLPEGGLTGTTPDRQPLALEVGDRWAEFITNGDPGWERYEPGRRSTMIFDRESTVHSDPATTERRFWDDLLVPETGPDA